jgi:F-type H+-transporting ATPase subunit b
MISLISVAQAAEEAHAEEAVVFYQDAHFWVYVAFVMVVGILFKPVFKAATVALDARANSIKTRIDEAQKLCDDAQEALALYKRKQRDALKDFEEIVNSAKAEAEALAAQGAKDLAAALARREQQALDRIAQAEAQALREVQSVAVDVAIEAARSVLSKSLTGDAAAKLVDGAIKELPAKFH